MSLIHFIRVLLRRKKLLFLVPVIAMTSGFYFLRNMPSDYKSEAMLSAGIVDDTKIQLEEDKSESSAFVIQTKFSNLIQLIKSRSVIDLVSYRLLEHDLTSKNPFRTSPEFNACSEEDKQKMAVRLRESISTFQLMSFGNDLERQIKKLVFAQKYEHNELMKQLKIDRNESSDYVKMEYQSENPELSAYILNTLCETFLGYYKSSMVQKTNNSIEFFSKMASEKKTEVDGLVDNLKQFKLDHKIINLYEQTKTKISQISELEMHKEEMMKQVPALKEALKNINSRFSPEEKKYIDIKLAPSNERLSQLKERINSLSVRIVADENNRALQDSLAVQRSLLKETVGKLSNELLINPNITRQELIQKKINYEIELDMAVEGIKSNEKELERLYTLVESFAPSEASISSYEREISVAAQSYLLILNKLNLAKFSMENIGNNLQQTEKAFPPDKPEPNKKTVVIILLGAITFVLTIVIIFILEYIDLTTRSAVRFSKFTGIDPLVSFNTISSSVLDIRRLFEDRSGDIEFKVLRNSIRNLRAKISSGIKEKSSLLFTSTSERSGKTFTVAALAYSLHLTGKRVLIIDLNNISNGLTTSFGATTLLSRGNEGTALPTATGISGIEILGIEQSFLSLGEVLNLQALENRLREYKTQYDYVLIESPSLNHESSSREIIPLVDAVFTVHSADSVILKADKNSLAELLKHETFFGCILNKVVLEFMEDSYGEIPYRRSKLRAGVKKIFVRNLANNNTKNSSVKL